MIFALRTMRLFGAGTWLPGVFALGVALNAQAADETPPPAEAPPSEIGRPIFVANDVDGQTGDAPAKHLAVNDDIVFNEDITTAADAKTVIEFRDGSTFEVGPDAVVRIDSFVFNPEESVSHKTLQVTRGVFRYVSGYTAGDQETKITSTSGALAIRGSVAAGIIDPDVPAFVYVGEGNAVFTNAAGSSALQPGNAIAVPSASTPPMAAAAMPAPVAVQALAVIDKRLPPAAALRNRPAADEAWLKRQGIADLVPAAAQAQRAAAVGGKPIARPASRGSLAGELGLLVEGNRVNLFHAGAGARTAEQTAFLARAARENPTAATALRRYTGEARTLHNENRAVGTRMVITGIGRAAPSAEVMRRVTEASIRANPGAAALIRQHAGEAYHGSDRGETNRRGTSASLHPTEHKSPGRSNERLPTAHTPPEARERRPVTSQAHERRPPPQRVGPGQPAQRQPTQRQPAQRQPEKKPPKKGEKDQKNNDQR